MLLKVKIIYSNYSISRIEIRSDTAYKKLREINHFQTLFLIPYGDNQSRHEALSQMIPPFFLISKLDNVTAAKEEELTNRIRMVLC